MNAYHVIPLILLLLYPYLFGYAETVFFSGGATVLPSVSVSKESDLNFGGIVPVRKSHHGSLKLIVKADGTLDLKLKNCTSIPKKGRSPASFSLSGQPDAPYAVTLSPSVTLFNGSDTMKISFPLNTVQGKSFSRSFNSSGTDSFSYGGELFIPRSPKLGVYEGTFSMTVNY